VGYFVADQARALDPVDAAQRGFAGVPNAHRRACGWLSTYFRTAVSPAANASVLSDFLRSSYKTGAVAELMAVRQVPPCPSKRSPWNACAVLVDSRVRRRGGAVTAGCVARQIPGCSPTTSYLDQLLDERTVVMANGNGDGLLREGAANPNISRSRRN
jgi:hypothetical protein